MTFVRSIRWALSALALAVFIVCAVGCQPRRVAPGDAGFRTRLSPRSETVRELKSIFCCRSRSARVCRCPHQTLIQLRGSTDFIDVLKKGDPEVITTAQRPHRRTRLGTSPLETYEPTREEILDMCEQIQSEWTPAEREKRRAVPLIPWTVPESPAPSV